MERLRLRAVRKTLGRKPWASEKDFIPLTSAAYRSTDGTTIHLDAKIEDVQAVLAKALKPERKLLTAVRFTDGRIEEVHSIRSPEGAEVIQLPTPEKERPKAEVAATVAVPNRGCPMPDFQEADIRASRVLETFLDPDQVNDYRKHGAFITRGVDTGRFYMVANRERPNMLAKCGGRQLFDMQDQVALCVHDWTVPPAEEMLALHLVLSTPGNEGLLRSLPDTFEA